MRWLYRARQFGMRLMARCKPVDHQPARDVLPEAAYQLFSEMSPGDQAHALCVLATVQRMGYCSPALEQAALLHDVGKAGAGLTLGHRVLIVLARALSADLLARLAQAKPGLWRHPFYVHAHHAELGARRCEQIGCAQRTIALVRYHGLDLPARLDDPELRQDLLALQRADNAC
jgi:hypothetical protein